MSLARGGRVAGQGGETREEGVGEKEDPGMGSAREGGEAASNVTGAVQVYCLVGTLQASTPIHDPIWGKFVGRFGMKR